MDNDIVNSAELQELILITSERLGIKDPSVIEKDYYVTRAITAISRLKNPYFKLVFCGGTCLAKAHKIINRMSEDIDFKLLLTATEQPLSRSQQKKEIKKLREEIALSVKNVEFELGGMNVRNEGQYISMELNYTSLFPRNTTLRPHLLLEFTVSNIRLLTNSLGVTSLIQSSFNNNLNLDSCELSCISIDETIAEKWVGLTRRVSAIKRGYLGEDDYLIRHLYDITTISTKNKIDDGFFTLSRDIVQQDAAQFKSQHPEYHADPYKEINHSLNLLENDTYWKLCYENFIDVMVFDSTGHLKYQDALQKLKQISMEITKI